MNIPTPLSTAPLQAERILGWQCPLCRKVHAPFVRECLCATLLSQVAVASQPPRT